MVGVYLMLSARFGERGRGALSSSTSNVGSADELHVEASVEHIGGRHALMHKTRFGADDFGKMGQESDDVMLGFALDLVDPRDIEFGVLALGPDLRRRLLGMMPNSAMASAACASISNQIRKRVSGDQIAAISGRV